MTGNASEETTLVLGGTGKAGRRLVLLSGRGEEGALLGEQAVRDAAATGVWND
jgi:hypothetical protein